MCVTTPQQLLRISKRFILVLLFGMVFAPFANVGAKAGTETGVRFTSIAGESLGATNLQDIQQRWGDSALLKTGDAGESLASLCYAVPDGVLLFLAGEMGGSNHRLGGFEWAKSTNRQPCVKQTQITKASDLSLVGVYLGMDVWAFQEVLGVPVELEGQTAKAFFQSKRDITQDELETMPSELQEMIQQGKTQHYFDVLVSVIARFEANKLVSVKVWKTETF